MNSKRSMWKVLLGVAAVGLLVTNCTIKTDDDDDTGCTPGQKKECSACEGVTGSQTCQADGSYGACDCPGSNNAGSSNGGGSSAGASNSSAGKGGETSSGGMSSASAGASGETGEGGAGGAGEETPTVFATCEDCLDARCATEFAACDADPDCISTNVDGSGQYERIAKCINQERVNGVVKRDVVRGCGVTLGVSADPDVISEWAPEDMAPATTNLLNCMADAPGAAAGSWANDDANFPVDGNDMINPTPWPKGSCAKDACTSAL
jgi:hypothetical protein